MMGFLACVGLLFVIFSLVVLPAREPGASRAITIAVLIVVGFGLGSVALSWLGAAYISANSFLGVPWWLIPFTPVLLVMGLAFIGPRKTPTKTI